MNGEVDFEVEPDPLPAGPNLPLDARHKLTENMAALYLLLGLYYLVPLAVLPYLVRTLGMEMYGLVAFTQSFAQYFTTFTDYGFNYSATRAIAQNRNDDRMISRIFCTVYSIKLSLAMAGIIVMLLLFAAVPRFRSDWAFFSLAYVGVIGNVLFPAWYFQGVERMRYISVIVGTARVLAGVMIFVFVHTPHDAILTVAIQSAGTVLGGLIGLITAVRRFRLTLRRPSLAHIREMLAEGWHLFVSSAAMGLYTNTNVFLVGALAGNSQAALFSAAEKLLRGLQALIGPAIQATFPHVSNLRAHSEKRALLFLGKSLRWIVGLTCIPSALVLVFAGPVTVLCFGHYATGCISVVRWIAFLPVLSALSNVLGINTMIPFGMDRQFSRIVIAAGLINVFLACILVPHWGANAAGVSILFAEIIVASGVIVALERRGIQVYAEGGMTA